MTNRYNALIVVLEKDMREDDAESLINAIKQLRGVISVSGNVTNPTNFVAQERARHDLSEKVWRALHPKE